MDEILFPTSPLALRAATGSSLSSPRVFFASFSAPVSPAAANGDVSSSSSQFLSPFDLGGEDGHRQRGPEELDAAAKRLEASVRILTERLNFLDPELEANANRIEILEAREGGGTERVDFPAPPHKEVGAKIQER